MVAVAPRGDLKPAPEWVLGCSAGEVLGQIVTPDGGYGPPGDVAVRVDQDRTRVAGAVGAGESTVGVGDLSPGGERDDRHAGVGDPARGPPPAAGPPADDQGPVHAVRCAQRSRGCLAAGRGPISQRHRLRGSGLGDLWLEQVERGEVNPFTEQVRESVT